MPDYRFIPMVAIVATLLAAAAPVAADDLPSWEAGLAAFEAGDYQDALADFEAAQRAGLDGPAVHYNIAVCQFTLGHYEAARDTFRIIATRFPRMRGLAEYNMGLAERRLGNTIAAQRHFIRAFELSPDDENLRALSFAMIRDIGPQQSSDWYGLVAVRGGHDDNVALRDSTGLPVGVTGESPLADLFATVRGPLPGLDNVLLDASLYVVAYPDAGDFDQFETKAGAVYGRETTDWWFEGGLFLTYGTLGGMSFNREIGADLRAVRYLDEHSSLEFRYRYDNISAAGADFGGIEGDRQYIDLRYRYDGERHHVSVRAGVERNDRLSPGVSPARERLQVDYRLDVREVWHLEAGMQFRASEYADLATPRTEDLAAASVGLSRDFGRAWQVSLYAQFGDNDSSDPQYSYQRTQWTIGALRSF